MVRLFTTENTEGNSAPTLQKELPLGLYVHIPFCVQKCRYCDFYSVTDASLHTAFVEAVCTEIRNRAFPPAEVDTLYIGGGTPSVLGPGAIEKILYAIFYSFTIRPNAEITLEINPGTIMEEDFRRYRTIGITRTNIGIQSFSDENLTFLGRCHTCRGAIQTLRGAREQDFESVGFDLIYGLPGQSHEDLEKDLATAVSFHPDHVSCYMLTYEPGTPLERQKRSGRIEPLADSLLADFFLTTSDFFRKSEYEHYEISNFARTPALRSRHNQKYWRHAPYMGFGPAAHSFRGSTRSWNIKDVYEYIRRTESTQPVIAGKETLTQEQLMMETLFLGLRTSDGVSLHEFEKKYQIKPTHLFSSLIEDLSRDGLLAIDDHRMMLSRKGMLFHDYISSRFSEMI